MYKFQDDDYYADNPEEFEMAKKLIDLKSPFPIPRKPNTYKNQLLNELEDFKFHGDILPYEELRSNIGLDNKYTKGMNINVPDEFADDFLNEYERINNNGNDPLLMYILMKNAQDNFSNGPIGSDGYFETYDPNLNENLEEDYYNFLRSFYPDKPIQKINYPEY